jgi:hypothetical protein
MQWLPLAIQEEVAEMIRAALVFPVLEGKDARSIANQFKARSREYEQSRRRLGITMERAYVQHTPGGDFVVAYDEAEGDPIESFKRVAQSDLEFDRWFVKAVKEIHGVDLSQPLLGPAPQTVALWFDPAVRERRRGLAFCAPIQSGEAAKTLLAEIYGSEDFVRTRRELKQNGALCTITPTAEGEVAAIYLESADPAATIAGFAGSADPFNRRFREQLGRLFGPSFELTTVLKTVEELFDSTRVADLGISKAA